MNNRPSSWLKPALIGTACGLAAFVAMTLARAAGPVSVSDLRSNPKAFVGQTVTVTGIAKKIRAPSFTRRDQLVPYYQLDLHEVDGQGRVGPHYVFVSLPVSAFSNAPTDGSSMSISGPLRWPYQVAVIDE